MNKPKRPVRPSAALPEAIALSKAARSLLEHHQFQPSARALYETCKDLVGSTAGYVALWRENSEDIDLLFLDAGGVPSTVDPLPPMPLSDLGAGSCRRQRVVYENDFSTSPPVQFLPQGHAALENVLFAPIILSGIVVGLLCLANKVGGFTENDALAASAFADLVAFAFHRSRDLQLAEAREEHIRLVAQSAQYAIVTADDGGNVVFSNPAAERIFGYRSEEILGLPLIRLVPLPLAAMHERAFSCAFDKGTLETPTWPRETMGCRFDGTEVPLELSLSLWKSGGKRFCTGIIREITDIKRAEENSLRSLNELGWRIKERTAELGETTEHLHNEMKIRLKTEERLAEAEARYRIVADFTYDWEYWENPENVLNYCSPSCERITGYSVQEFMTNPDLLQQIVHPEDAGIWQKHREEGRAAPGPSLIQFRIYTKNRSIRWLEHVCQPVMGKDGGFLGIRASNRDITRRHEADLETQRLREEIAHVTRVTTAGQLAASLAHELNQPLAAILCNAQAAERFLAAAQPDLREVQEALSDIRDDSQRAGRVIQRLRTLFSKTGQERNVLHLNELVRETMRLLRTELMLKATSVQFELAPELPDVMGNRVEVQQVVLNLVINALEAMAGLPPSGRRLLLRTGPHDSETVRVSICDSGPGIPEGQLDRLFEPFFTTKPEGMGMGLAISRSIIEAHGGSLWAANNPGQGATFHFTLLIHREGRV